MAKYMINGNVVARSEKELRSYYQEKYDENVAAGNIDENEVSLEDWMASDEEL